MDRRAVMLAAHCVCTEALGAALAASLEALAINQYQQLVPLAVATMKTYLDIEGADTEITPPAFVGTLEQQQQQSQQKVRP